MFLIFTSSLLLLTIVFLTLPETNYKKNKDPRLVTVFNDYVILIKNKKFIAFMVSSSSCAGIFLLWLVLYLLNIAG